MGGNDDLVWHPGLSTRAVARFYLLCLQAKLCGRLGNTGRAAMLYERALRVFQRPSLAAVVCARGLLELGRVDRPIEILVEALEWDPSSESVLLALAQAYRMADQHEKVIETYEKLAVHHPISEAGHLIIGYSLFQVGRYAEAREVYRELLERDPLSTDALHGLAVSYDRLGCLQEAQDALDRLRRLQRRRWRIKRKGEKWGTPPKTDK
jgi:tetratricopeptide (TPR) repeat protein